MFIFENQRRKMYFNPWLSVRSRLKRMDRRCRGRVSFSRSARCNLRRKKRSSNPKIPTIPIPIPKTIDNPCPAKVSFFGSENRPLFIHTSKWPISERCDMVETIYHGISCINSCNELHEIHYIQMWPEVFRDNS